MRFFRNRKLETPSQTAFSPAPTPAVQHGTLLPRSLFDESTYLQANPDVAAAVETGSTTAYQHYVAYGHGEELAGRRSRSLPTQSSPLGVRFNPDDAIYDRLTDLEVEKRALLEAWDRQLPHIGKIHFDMLAENVPDEVVPPLDRTDCDEGSLDPDQRFWRATMAM